MGSRANCSLSTSLHILPFQAKRENKGRELSCCRGNEDRGSSSGEGALNNEGLPQPMMEPCWTAGIEIHAAAHSAWSLPTDGNWLSAAHPLFTLQLCPPQNGNHSVTGIRWERRCAPCRKTPLKTVCSVEILHNKLSKKSLTV